MTDNDPERWLAEVKAGTDARTRRRQRWLEQQDSEAATLQGLLHDLAESPAEAIVDTRSSGRHRGRVRGVGLDVVIIASNRSQGLTLLSLADTVSVRSGDNSAVRATRSRGPTFDATMQELLVDQMAERNELTLVLVTGERIMGRLVSVGHDIVGLRRSVDDPTMQIVIAAIAAAII
ncbi:MAG: hypothetical protein GY708_08830 [Actinomycetia bacterium]|nr:hypothetical protein [Actinomycetes bacterium]MCP4962283.1 hypothetical protein [Actinomycetes bacterium]